MWQLHHKEGWVPKNWCFQSVVLEKSLESPLDCKEIQPVHPKGNQSWIIIGRTDVEAETPILWPPDTKNWLTKKDSLEKIKGKRRKGWQRMRWLDGITNSTDIVWVNSRSWWWTGRLGMLQSMGSQRVGYDWVTELNCWWTFSLLLCLGYCKQCCNEHWGGCILLGHVFLWVYAQEWDCRVIW